MIARLSYLLDLLDAAPSEPLGESAADAMSPLADDPALFEDLLFTMQYGHLCELMPEIHRGWLEVSGSRAGGFWLDHTDPAFADSEVRDVVLTEISRGFNRPPLDESRELFDEICMSDGLDARLIAETQRYYHHYLNNCFEVPLFDEPGWQAALGVAGADFERFRAIWLAWSESAIRMTEALARRLSDGADSDVADELFEWAVPFFTAEFLEGSALAISGLDSGVFDALMGVFAYQPGANTAGDGFFPPVHRLGGGLVFSPDAVRSMISSRNVAYALNRRDNAHFANLLSPHLEPQLLQVAASTLAMFDEVVIRPNVPWENGEIDLLAFDARSNVAVQIQGKAPISPQGARMTQAVESRAMEALDQLRVFRELPQDDIDRIVSQATGLPVSGVVLHDLLLVRACLGTNRVWSELGDVVPANLHLLHAAALRTVRAGLGLDALLRACNETLDKLVRESFIAWERAEVDLGSAQINVPLLRLDEQVLSDARAEYLP